MKKDKSIYEEKWIAIRKSPTNTYSDIRTITGKIVDYLYHEIANYMVKLHNATIPDCYKCKDTSWYKKRKDSIYHYKCECTLKKKKKC